MLTRAMSSSGYARDSAVCATLGPSDLRRLREGEAPREREQRAADQPGVQAETDPTRLGHRPLGEHQQAHDRGRREAEEEQIGVAGAGHGPLQDDLVPPPDQVAEGRHRRGEGEEQPGGSKADAAAARVEEAGHGGGARRGAQPEVAHDQGDFAASPSRARNRRRIPRTPGPGRVAGPGSTAPRKAGGRDGSAPGAGCARSAPSRVVVERRWRTHRALPVRAAPGSRGSRCTGCACLLRWRACGDGCGGDGSAGRRAVRAGCRGRRVGCAGRVSRSRCQGRRRRPRRVGSFVHRPCIARRPPHSLKCPSPAPNGARRSPCRDDTPVSSLRDIVPLRSVTTRDYASTDRVREVAEGTGNGLHVCCARRAEHARGAHLAGVTRLLGPS